MLADIIVEECLRRAIKPKSRVSIIEMRERLKEISSDIKVLRPIPSFRELSEKYNIRDKKDLKILYSADKTGSVIIVTQDRDFF